MEILERREDQLRMRENLASRLASAWRASVLSLSCLQPLADTQEPLHQGCQQVEGPGGTAPNDLPCLSGRAGPGPVYLPKHRSPERSTFLYLLFI